MFTELEFAILDWLLSREDAELNKTLFFDTLTQKNREALTIRQKELRAAHAKLKALHGTHFDADGNLETSFASNGATYRLNLERMP